MKKVFYLFILTMFLILSLNTYTLGMGARALGMGGAYTALAEGPIAAFWNPAGLTRTKHINIGLSLGMSGSDLELLQKANEEGFYFDYNEPFTLRMDAFAAVQLKNMGLSLLEKGFIDYNVDPKKFTAMQHGEMLFTMAFEIDALSLGGNLKFIKQEYAEAAEDQTGGQGYELYSHGKGVGVDFGLLYKFGDLAAFGMKVADVSTEVTVSGEGTNYTANSLSPTGYDEESFTIPEETKKIDSLINMGLAIKPVKSLTLSADIHKVGKEDQSYHLGAEQKVGPFALRFGYEKLYIFQEEYGIVKKAEEEGFSLGAGIDLYLIAADLAVREDSKGFTYVMGTAMIKF